MKYFARTSSFPSPTFSRQVSLFPLNFLPLRASPPLAAHVSALFIPFCTVPRVLLSPFTHVPFTCRRSIPSSSFVQQYLSPSPPSPRSRKRTLWIDERIEPRGWEVIFSKHNCSILTIIFGRCKEGGNRREAWMFHFVGDVSINSTR